MEYVDGLRITDYCRVQELGLDSACGYFSMSARQWSTHIANLWCIAISNRQHTGESQRHPQAAGFRHLQGCCCRSRSIRSEDTFSEGRMMTPDYASPEQLREAATPAFEHLLTGGSAVRVAHRRQPHRFAIPHCAKLNGQSVKKKYVRPSSTVADRGEWRQLKGDLDLILLTALAKDPRRRYGRDRDSLRIWNAHLAPAPGKRPCQARPTYRAG